MTDAVDEREALPPVATMPAGGAVRVCPLRRLTPDRGAAALVGDHQVAVFRLSVPRAGASLFAIGNRDPFSGAHVLSRGIVGDAGGVPKVASPVYKQAFDLRTGTCLDDPSVRVPTYPVAVDDEGWVVVGPAVSADP
ncbi:MAG TPA: nitrite reductase small subunit NirD [Acidimicrobiales bacterium]|nr:nitrite reductase small subunit NirD [Acidimicrobiales bacterium]